MRWHYRDPLLVWLLPASYALHILEEWFGGFPEWFAFLAGSPLPRQGFVAINAVAFALMLAASRAATKREERAWLIVAIATVLFVNGLAHLAGSLASGRYSPGLFTGIVFYLPIAGLTLLRAGAQAAPGVVGRGVLAGLIAQALVAATAYLWSAA